MKAIIETLANVIDFLVDTVSFTIRMFNFVPASINNILVYVAELPLFLNIPIVASVFCAFLRAWLSRGGSTS